MPGERTIAEAEFDLKIALGTMIAICEIDHLAKVVNTIVRARAWREKTGSNDVLDALRDLLPSKGNPNA